MTTETTNLRAWTKKKDQVRRWTIVTDAWFLLPAVVACLVFAAIVTQGSGRFFVHEALGSFYDAQATSLLHGRLDVPPESIQWEGFLHDGKWYGYFGPTPALLRLPFALAGVGAGRLTRLFLLGYFASALLASYLLLRDATEHATGRESPRPLWTVLLVLNAGLGSTLLFLSGRAYVYHEALLCGAAFALWSVWATLRYLRRPETKWWIAALICGVLSVQARPPAGLFALTCLFLAAGQQLCRRWRARQRFREPGWIAIAALAGVLSFNGIGFLKFGTFEGCPLRMNLQYTPERLAAIDGRQFHWGNLGYGAAAYLAPNAHLAPYFPYIEMAAPAVVRFPGAKMDLTDGIVGFPFAMPALTIAAMIALAAAVRRPTKPESAPAMVLWLALIPLADSLFMAVAVAHRYTADFCPFLIAAAALGLVALDRWTPGRRTASVLLVGATVAVIPATVALTVDFQGARAWGVPQAVRSRYAEFRREVDHAVGRVDPQGYDPDALPARSVDRRIVTSVITTLAADPRETSRGIAVCRAVADDFPAEPAPRLQLALLLCNAGRAREGMVAFEDLLRRFPDFAPAHYYVAILYARSNRFADADHELQTAARLDPANRDYRAALQMLRAATPH